MSKLVSPCYNNKLKKQCSNREYCIEHGRKSCVAYCDYERNYNKNKMEDKLLAEIVDYSSQTIVRGVNKAYKRRCINKSIGSK